jgi:hypothetical protein
VQSESDPLAKKLAASVSGDTKDFEVACKSVLGLPDKPMSSPWFETSGGRLRDNIKYSLSAKGRMFVRLLKAVKESGANSDKSAYLAKFAVKTLEKLTRFWRNNQNRAVLADIGQEQRAFVRCLL